MTMFTTTVASMRIGVAIPIVNSAFRDWDTLSDTASWTDPTGWADTGPFSPQKAVSAASIFSNDVEADGSSLVWLGTSAADDTTSTVLLSDFRKYFWGDVVLDAAQKFYAVMDHYNTTIATGGPNKEIAVRCVTATDSSGTSSLYDTIFNWTATSATGWTVLTNEFTPSAANGWRHAAIQLMARDLTSGVHSVQIKRPAMMFDPNTKDGYLELTNIFPTNGPAFGPMAFSSMKRDSLGRSRMHDPSGGGRKFTLNLEWRNEDIATYESMLRLWHINQGLPGMEPLPLLIQPNVPGLPSTLMCNWVGGFQLSKQGRRAGRYGGNIQLEEVWG